MTADRPAVLEALKEVYDPCCADRGISIVDMGVVEDVRVRRLARRRRPRPHERWCPFVASMSSTIPDALKDVAGCRDRRRAGRLGPRLDDGPPVPGPPARSSKCRSSNWSPTAQQGAPPDGHDRSQP